MLKLPRHNRYDHLPINKRQHYSWPGGKRLAFFVALNIEHFAFQTGRRLIPNMDFPVRPARATLLGSTTEIASATGDSSRCSTN